MGSQSKVTNQTSTPPTVRPDDPAPANGLDPADLHGPGGVEHSDLSTSTVTGPSGIGFRSAARPGDIAAVHEEEAEPQLGGGHERWGILRYKHYRNILSAQFFSNIGTWTEMFAIQMFIAQKTGRLDDQGFLGVCQQLPIFLFGLFGGLMADRVNRRTLLVVSQILAGFVAAGVAMVVTFQSRFADARTPIHWLFALGAVNGVVMAFNFPAWQVLTPRLVPRNKLMQAITLNGIQFNMARVLGPAIAGYVLASFGSPPLLWFNTISFFMMAGVVMTTPDSPIRVRSTESVSRQVKEALSFLIHERGPRAVVTAQILLSLLAAPLVRLLSNFVIDVYSLKEQKAEAVGGTLLAIQGIGAVAGGLALRRVPTWYPKHHFIPMAVTGLGITISLFALTTTVWAGYLAMAVCGWFWIWAFNQSWAAIQVLTPDHLRGRALSITTMCVFGATALGVWVAGFLGEWVKREGWLSVQHATQGSVLLLSVPLICVGVWMMTHRVPEVDGLPSGPSGARGTRSLLNAITANEHRPRVAAEPPEGVV